MLATLIFETPRLKIVCATEAHADFLFVLWTHPQVMQYVGFPHGLRITRDEIRDQIREKSAGAFGYWLVVLQKVTGQPVGECHLLAPDETGIARTDVKLMPEFWGQHFGVEIKRGLLDYLFVHTNCRVVEATPNVNNVASIKMQEAVGGQRVGEGVFEPPADKLDYMCAVPHYIYHVTRQTWERTRPPEAP